MSKDYFIGMDIGTSGTKGVITDINGRVLAQTLEENGLHSANPVWAEQDASCYLDASIKVISTLASKSGIEPENIKAMCISGLYGGSGIPLNSNMEPIHPCIIWMDRRAEKECDQVSKLISKEELFSITGNGIDPYFGFLKMLWLKNNRPDVWEKTAKFLTPNQYVIYKFTGSAVIDHTSAGNLGGIYDMRNHCWSQPLMEKLGIPVSKLPEKIVRPQDIAGYLTKEAANQLGLWEGMPVCAGCIDCLASTLATGALYAGQHVAIVSTSINWGVIHSELPTNPDYVSMPYLLEPEKMTYTYGGASTAGALLRWFRDEVMPFVMDEKGEPVPTNYSEMDKRAENIEAGSRGLIVLPYFMGERSPIWDVNARGVVFGLTLQHSFVHIYHALLEAVAFSLRHIMETSNIALSTNSSCTLVGGASRSKLWRQIFADVTGVPIIYSAENIEAPLGDALIAAVGAGYVPDFEVIKNWVCFENRVEPNMENHAEYNRYYDLYKKLYLSLKDNMHALAKFGK